MRAVVVSHGEVDPTDAAHVRAADLVIAADGGTLHLEAWGIEPQHVVGDLDSLPDEVRERLHRSGRNVEVHPREKDRSDTEIALDRALELGADDVVVVGALGGPRLDHELANTLLLLRRRSAGSLRLVRGGTSVRLVRRGETAELTGPVGGVVSLLALTGDVVVTTRGLRYPLTRGSLPLGASLGVSNEVAKAPASVSCESGALLLVESGALAPRQEPQPKA